MVLTVAKADGPSEQHATLTESREAADVGARVDELNTLAWEIRYTDYQRGLGLSEEAYQLALALGDSRRLAYSLRNKSFCLFRLSRYTEALENAQKALELFSVLGDKRGLEGTHNTLGVLHAMTGRLAQGLEHFHATQELCQELGDGAREAFTLDNIGNSYCCWGDYANALTYYQRAATLRETLQDDRGRAQSLGNIGLTLYRIGDHQEALGYIHESLALAEAGQDAYIYANTLGNLGLVYGALREFDKALECHQQSLSLKERTGDTQGVSETLANMGAVYAEKGNDEEAKKVFTRSLTLKRELGDGQNFAAVAVQLGALLAKGRKFKAALRLLHEALASAEAANLKEDVYKAHLALSDVYKQKKLLGKALAHFEHYCRVKEEAFDESSDQKLRSLRVSFETERKEREKEIYRLKNAELTEANAELEHLTRSLQEADREKSALLARLERQAQEDPLTGLYNRRHFDAELEKEFARARRFTLPMSVALLDLDHFKRINDTFSHAVGDEVLRVTAQLFKAHFREVDTVARYGGEEFVLLLPQTGARDATLTCESFRRTVEAYPWDGLQPDLRVTVSVGISDDLNVDTHEKLLAKADDKLYRAKREGRNQTAC